MKLNITLTGKSLAAIAVAFLAVVAALAGSMARGTGAGPGNTAELVQTIVDEKDHVTPGELAQWIVNKRQDYLLIDIRAPWQYDDYHIPTAINIPLAQFFQEANLRRLDRSKKIVVYGLGSGHAAETQLLLSMKGYNAYSLHEGISEWWDLIITPTSLRSETQSPAGYQQAKQLREYFAGGVGPQGEGTAAPAMPQIPVAAPSSQPQPEQKKLKLGKGCS
jgi:rhodanese-related sulfurtransferase